MKRIVTTFIALALALSLSFAVAVPALAAPEVASWASTMYGFDVTDHAVTMPGVVEAGDLLIVIFTNRQGATDATVATPDGWTGLASIASGLGEAHVRVSVYYRIADGTEGATWVSFQTAVARQSATQVYRITGWHGTTPPEISGPLIDVSLSPNPAALSPTWGEEETLWIAIAGQQRGDQAGTVSYPTHYTDGFSWQSGPDEGLCTVHSARRVIAVASEDPDPFAITASSSWVAFTLAVRPYIYPAVGGTAQPVNGLALLGPWILLGAAIIAGAAVFMRRHQTQN